MVRLLRPPVRKRSGPYSYSPGAHTGRTWVRLHRLSCRRGASEHQRHNHLNDIIWKAIKRAQVPAVKEPVSLIRDDSKRPDGTTFLPCAAGKSMAWNVTVPDTYAEFHISNTSTNKPRAVAHQARQNTSDKMGLVKQHTSFTHLPSRQLIHGTTSHGKHTYISFELQTCTDSHTGKTK